MGGVTEALDSKGIFRKTLKQGITRAMEECADVAAGFHFHYVINEIKKNR